MDPQQAQALLDSILTEDERTQYYQLLRRQFLFSEQKISRIDFDSAIQQLLKTNDKVKAHITFQLAIATKIHTPDIKNQAHGTGSRGSFEMADYTEYVSPISPLGPPTFENKYAAAELFLPDNGFISSRVAIHAWKNRMDGASDDVAKYLVQACQMFVKNIITAMVTRKEGYKLKDRFQHGIGTPVPDPFLRNTHNVVDHTQEPCLDLVEGEESFRPKTRVSLENAEHQTTYALSCAKRKRSDGCLSMQLLYDTLREDPSIVAINSIHNIILLKIGLILENKRVREV